MNLFQTHRTRGPVHALWQTLQGWPGTVWTLLRSHPHWFALPGARLWPRRRPQGIWRP